MDRINMDSILNLTESSGIFEMIVPSFLVFIMIFYALMESHFLTKKKSIIVALLITAVAVIMQVLGVFGSCWNLFEIINNALRKLSILIVAGIMMYVFLAIFGIKMNKMREYSYLIFSVILITFTTIMVYTRPAECINHLTNLLVIVGVAFLLNLLQIFGKKRSHVKKRK